MYRDLDNNYSTVQGGNGNKELYIPLYKIVLIGESGVGKSSILTRYVKGIFPQTIPTIALEFCTKELKMSDGSVVRAQLWDTAGQEKFKSLAATYYRKAKGVLLVYDLTRKDSLSTCLKLIETLKQFADPDCMLYLVGNKTDLELQREVRTRDGELFAKENNCFFIETSAISNKNVGEVFESLIEKIHSKQITMTRKDEESVVVDLNQKKEANSSTCCGFNY